MEVALTEAAYAVQESGTGAGAAVGEVVDEDAVAQTGDGFARGAGDALAG